MEEISSLSKIEENVTKVMVGKTEVTKLLLASLVAGGHVLLEDVPGTGKIEQESARAVHLHCCVRHRGMRWCRGARMWCPRISRRLHIMYCVIGSSVSLTTRRKHLWSQEF